MAISKILKKAKPKARPKVKPKKRITPMELKEEVNRIKKSRPGRQQDRDINRLIKKYDDNVQDFIMNEVMRDLKAKGGRVRRRIDQLPSRTGRLVELMKEGKIKGGGKPGRRPKQPRPAPKPILRPARPKKPAPKPILRPARPKKPAPKPILRSRRPKPGDRMVLPSRPRRNPEPRLPRAMKELTPEQKRRIMQLVKKGRRTTRPIRKR